MGKDAPEQDRGETGMRDEARGEGGGQPSPGGGSAVVGAVHPDRDFGPRSERRRLVPLRRRGERGDTGPRGVGEAEGGVGRRPRGPVRTEGIPSGLEPVKGRRRDVDDVRTSEWDESHRCARVTQSAQNPTGH